MSSFEDLQDQGFFAICAHHAPVTFQEGAVLLGGAIAATGFSWLAQSVARSEVSESNLDAIVSSLPFDEQTRARGLATAALQNGMDVQELKKVGRLLLALPDQPTKTDLEPLMRLAKKANGYRFSEGRELSEILKDVLPGDLRKVSLLPVEAIDAGVVASSSTGVDWQKTQDNLKVFEDMPLHILQYARVPPRMWLSTWREVVQSDDAGDGTQMDMLYKLGAVGELVRSKSGTALVEKLSKQCTPYRVSTCDSSNKHAIRRLSKVAKSGVLKQLDDLFLDLEEEGNAPDSSEFGRRARALYKYPDDLIGWATLGELDDMIAVAEQKAMLEEQAEAEGKPKVKKPVLEDPLKKDKRAFDRLAQSDPDWAITEYPYEYQRGKRIARLMDEATRYVIDLANKGQKVVIHGRDGEMIMKMLDRYPNVNRKNISYVLSSRPLTTEGPIEPKTDVDKDYRRYLLRMIPEGAVHVDTGYKGRIPRWLDENVVKIGPIRMISAENPEEEMPIMPSLSPKKKRRIVLSDLEYSSQRLDLPKRGGWDKVTYSYGAPGFWARFYGIMDALRLPRSAKTTSRFEARR